MKIFFLIHTGLLSIIILIGYIKLTSYSEVILPEYSNTGVNEVALDLAYRDELKVSNIDLGVYVIEPLKNQFSDFVAFEKNTGYKVDSFLIFIAWGDEKYLDPQYKSYFDQFDVSPVITWEPWQRNFEKPDIVQPEYSLASIANGEHDEYIAKFGLSLKYLNRKVVLRFAHEMNTLKGYPVWYPWQGDPDNYKKAFQRIYDIFQDQEAFNVEFLWSPIYFTGSADSAPYYPGNEIVDLVGFTAINMGEITGPKGEDYGWEDCDVLIDRQYSNLNIYNKPLYVTELLSNDVGGSKADWYFSCVESLLNKPEIVSITSVQIDEHYEYTHNKVDWRVNSSEDSLRAFRRMLSELNR